MFHAPFVHFRSRSAYSLSEGAIQVSDLVKMAEKNRMPALALTDHANLFGALEFSLKAQRVGVQPVLGCLLDLNLDDADKVRPTASHSTDGALVLLTKDEQGWDSLKRFISRLYVDQDPGARTTKIATDLAAVGEQADGLVALTGGARGPIGRLLVAGRTEQAERLFARLMEMFPDRLYMEIQRHGLPEESATEPHFLRMAYDHNIPLLATNDIHFAESEAYEAHDCLLCIRDGLKAADPDRERLTPEHRFRSPEEMQRLFHDLPEAVDNTLALARRCSFLLEGRAPLLPAMPGADGGSEMDLLGEQAKIGIERRLEHQVWNPGMDAKTRNEAAVPYRERLDYELGVIAETGYAGYFLIVAEFVNWALEQGISVGPGRGSGAGSVVAWALKICDVDPLRFGLLFERFLNPERVSMPDFDIDFCVNRREEVIAHVRERYGSDRVAQIVTFGSLQARAAVRDVGRVLGIPYPRVDGLAKLVPVNPADPVSLSEALERVPELQKERNSDEETARLFDIALRLEGLYRNSATHAAGVVIGDRNIEELVPLYRDPKSDSVLTQYSMQLVEQAGLVKFDFLGLKMLTVLEEIRQLLQERDIEIVFSDIPLDHDETFALLREGRTNGIFQLEGQGMRSYLSKLAPDCFEDIVAMIALYRPGPMDNIPAYIDRKHGREKVDYPEERLEGILGETFGIWIYQEQVMQTAQLLAGFSLGEADLLRRAMGKKIFKEMKSLRVRFLQGAEERGVQRPTAERIFASMEKFAGYGFNKSHAVGYALISYWTAYFKTLYPAEFFAATMSSVDESKLNLFRGELSSCGINVLPPDINRSGVGFTVEKDEEGFAIRCGLGPIRNISDSVMQAAVETREESGEFEDVWDFARRVPGLSKAQVETLSLSGSLDRLEPDRARTFKGAASIAGHAAAAARTRLAGQESLFGNGSSSDLWVLPETSEWSHTETLAHEFETLGFYISGHPLDEHADLIKDKGSISIEEIDWSGNTKGSVVLAGIAMKVDKRLSKTGNRFARLQISDATGAAEIILFSEVFARCENDLKEGTLLLVTADQQKDDDRGDSLIARSVNRLDSPIPVKGYLLIVEENPAFDALRAAIDHADKGDAWVRIVMPEDPDHEVEIDLGTGVTPSVALRSVLKSVAGVRDVREISRCTRD